MKRILFIVIPEKGHINPSIGVAQHLQAKGHHVEFYSAGDLSAQLLGAGLTQFQVEESSPANTENQGPAFSRSVEDKVWLRDWIKLLLIEAAPSAIEPFRKVLRDFSPDVLVLDPMIYPAVIAVELENVRWVALSNSLNPVLNDQISSDLLDTVSWMSKERDRLFQTHGVDMQFRGCDALSLHLTIAFTTEEFTACPVPGVHQVGPSVPVGKRGDETEFPRAKINEELPLIYMSFGSQVYHQLECFEKVIRAVEGQPLQLVAVMHNLVIPDLPENVIACGYAPQLELLERAKIVITHGGANTVMESLRVGLPILIHPICNDQFHQSWFIENTGCGKEVNLREMSVSEIREHFDWALNDACLKEHLKRVKQSYQRDGALNAANLIEEIFVG